MTDLMSSLVLIDQESLSGTVLADRLAAVLPDLSEHFGYEEPMETLDDLTGRWAVVVDALSGVPGVTPYQVRYALECLDEVARRLRAVLPAQDVPIGDVLW